MHEDIMVVDKDYRITDVNNMFVTTSGHNREDIIGRHCYEISHGLSQPCHRHGEECLLETVFETGEARNCRHEHLHADGSRVIVDILFSPLLDEKGDVTHVIEAMRDVTELYRMETDLRKSEEKYRHLVESTPDWVWACDLEGRQTFANAAVKNILGYEIQEILGNLAEDFIYPEDWKKIQNWLKKSLKDKTGWKHSIARWRHKDGSIRFLESMGQPVLDPKGNLIGFTGINRDVTKRKLAEEDLKRFEKAVESSTDAIGISTADGKHYYQNKAFDDLFGEIGENPPSTIYVDEAVGRAKKREAYDRYLKQQIAIRNAETQMGRVEERAQAMAKALTKAPVAQRQSAPAPAAKKWMSTQIPEAIPIRDTESPASTVVPGTPEHARMERKRELLERRALRLRRCRTGAGPVAFAGERELAVREALAPGNAGDVDGDPW